MSALPSIAAPWMVYGLVVGALLAAVARLGESALRAAGRPSRWIWAAALGLTVVLVAIAPARGGRGGGFTMKIGAGSVAAAAPAAAPAGWTHSAAATLAAAARAVAEPLHRTLDAARRLVPASIERWLVVGWLVLSAGLLALFAFVHARFARARGRWPLADLHGTRVRIAPDAGPAVVGLSRPEIVVPGWLLERTADEQRLVLAHEREHVAARDPLLLAAGCVAVAILPWHPAAWWMLSRLRLAVELDCDARVLRRGVAARSYGTLLIDLAGRCSGLRIGAPALADESSHLQQRLIAMTPRLSRFTHARSAAAAAIAAVALLAACEAKLPTQTEVNDMTAATATASAQKMQLLSSDSARYQVNGVAVSAAEANGIPANRITSIQVMKGASAPDGKALVSITTREPGDTSGGSAVRTRFMIIDGAPSNGAKRFMITDRGAAGAGADSLPRDHLQQFDGVILIDGVRSSPSAMHSLTPDDIVSVEVIKGASAASLYDAPEAKNGVIRITTKKGAAKH